MTFLATAPAKAALDALALPPSGRDELVVDGREVYVHTPDGYAEPSSPAPSWNAGSVW